MKRKTILIIVTMTCVMLAFSGSNASVVFSEIRPDLPVVSAHTSGLISRESPIQIQFAANMAAPDPLQNAFLNFKPEIKGVTIWRNSRTLEFWPKHRLLPGQMYHAVLNLSQIIGRASKPFEFQFVVMKPSFDINVDGLQAASRTDLKKLKLTGKVITTEAEGGTLIMKLLKAEQNGKGLNVQWVHSQNRQEHSFIIPGIIRQDQPSDVILQWDGTPIGSDKRGKRLIAVPPMGPFRVLEARAVHGEQQYLELGFTDPLEKAQELRGLIRTSDENRTIRFTIDGSIVRVYSSSPWPKNVTLHTELGIRNILGQRLGKRETLLVSFEDIKPQVRFLSKRVILPTTHGLSIPIETVNLREIIVKAIRVYEDNMPQFFQLNTLEENKELRRVGRQVWKKTISLDYGPENKNQWIPCGLDLTPLVQHHPGGGLFRLEVSFERRHITYPCPDIAEEHAEEADNVPLEDDWEKDEESSYWDTYGYDYWDHYEDRKNPCSPGYYIDYEEEGETPASVSRNLLISDIGLIAKQGNNGDVFVVATDIRTAQPIPGAELTLLDYQQQPLGTGTSDNEGQVLFHSERKPFLLVAKHGTHLGYLRLDDGSALSVSHFDVAGETVKKGLKGFFYGERGVWRPGDPIYLTFILMDSDNRLPKNHPILFELRNPQDQLVISMKKTESVNGFYSFKTETDPDAPTGNWTARIKAGGVTFEKVLKIEMVRPNRLKIGLDFGTPAWYGGKITGQLSARWLHGAIAKNLDADVELAFSSAKTWFPKYDAYIFDDPVRKYEPETQVIFDGQLDEKGMVTVVPDVWPNNVSPGMLMANFKTRVFEPGGAFSTDRFSIPCHPYERYVGVRLPKGDKARGMLLTDTPHTVSIAMVDNQGEPVARGKVEVRLYKIKWRWWWEKGPESIAEYIDSDSYTPIQTESVEIRDGKGEWPFEIKYPSWGRYLVSVCDSKGRHCSGKPFYVDWPGWAGRSQKDAPGGASVLSFSADKEEYKVGETVSLSIPTGNKGRGLVSIESGTKVVQAEWITANGEPHTRYEFTATQDMSPNVYAHVTFLQPHLQAGNDLPIRMYGVIPIKVLDPGTRVDPILGIPETFVPEETAKITVRESDGKPMTYTLAIVDEGLLDLTRFETPDPWNHFYKREALGVKTWDLFDMVAGAYGGTLEQLLAIGGDDAILNKGKKKAHRFPPMVRFIGPLELGKDAENIHSIDIPQYVGSVRVMVVAGQDGAFGAEEAAVFVRKPLMVLATLPRVLGPDEEVEMPISVFAMDDEVKEVSVTVTSKGPLSIVGSPDKSIAFSEPGDDIIFFRLKADAQVGVASVSIQARSGEVTAEQKIELDIRMPGGPVLNVVDTVISKHEIWKQGVTMPGMAGTNKATLEVSRIPPINLGKRLNYLIRYPHGCVEQTTSSVFPQLYLDKLLRLSPEKQDEIQKNIKAGIRRLQTFQGTHGGFLYWPGANKADDWATSYAGHFLLEAEKMGYLMPPGLLGQWKQYQRKHAVSWMPKEKRSELIQAYRLYTLALAGAAELGAMNRLREAPFLPAAARWRLAAAYQMAGQPQAARNLAQDGKITVAAYRELSNTYGSDLRDRAMILESLCLMNQMRQVGPLATAISEELSSDKSLSTQTTAYALIAMARHAGIAGDADEMRFAFSWNDGEEEIISSAHPLVQKSLTVGALADGRITVKNVGNAMLWPRMILEGTPAVGKETASANGFKMAVAYSTLDGKPLDPETLDQGTDFAVEVTLTNIGHSGNYEEVALSHLFPSGWEIRNMRMDMGAKDDGASGPVPESAYDYQDVRDDRVHTYFDISQGETKIFRTLVNASYLGKFYLPMVTVEAMYDATIHGRIPGEWVRVIDAGEND